MQNTPKGLTGSQLAKLIKEVYKVNCTRSYISSYVTKNFRGCTKEVRAILDRDWERKGTLWYRKK
jgi:hypothetical protein